MPRTLSFWQSSQDEADFFSFLQRGEDFISHPFEIFTKPEIDIIKSRSLNAVPSPNEPCYLYMGLSKHIDIDIFEIREKPHKGYYISDLKAPVMVYRRPKLTGPTIGQTSLSMYDHYLDQMGQKTVKPADFIKWTKQTINWLKRRASEKLLLNGYPYPATPNAVALVNSGDTLLTF